MSTLAIATKTELAIELHAFYDNDLSQMYFDDFFSENSNCVKPYENRNGYEYLVIGDLQANHYTKTALNKMRKDDLFELLTLHNKVGYYDDVSNFNKKELVVMASQITNEQYYEVHFKESYYHDLECDFTVHGFSQGDTFKVNVIGDKEKTLAKHHLSFVDRDYLCNLFYSSPVYARLDVELQDGTTEEIFLSEFLDDEYTWNVDNVLDGIEKHHPELLEWCKENLPSTIDYQ